MIRFPQVLALERTNDSHMTRSQTLCRLGPRPVLLALAVLVLSVTGCGSSDNGVAAKSASEILQATRTAAQGASSVHVVTNSKIAHGESLALDASLAKEQGGAKVSYLGTSLEVIRSANSVYVKGNKVFAARLGAALGVKIPADTWLTSTVKGPLAQTAAFTKITTELPLILSGTGKVTKGTSTKINGQPTITIKQQHKLYTGTLYVATTGQPYPLKLTKTGEETGEVTFTNWNDPVTVTAPAHAVNITQLQHTNKAH
jgi:hypothetical protein